VPDYSGSFSGSFQGNGNKLTDVDYYSLSNLPATITPFQKNSILANNSIRDNFVSNVKTRLNAESVISSSAQLTTEFDVRYGNELGDDLVSGSAQVKVLLPTGTVSGSAQIISNLPSGTISGSSQVDYDSILNKPTTITVSQKNAIVANTAKVGYTDSAVKSKLNTENVLSGSAQVKSLLPSGVISGSNQLPTGLVSGSSQIDYDSILNKPTTITVAQKNAIVANTAKVTYTAASLPTGTISSSAQITALGYSTTDNDVQSLSLSGNNLSISNGNTVSLAGLGGGGAGGSSIWNTGSQSPGSYTHLLTSNNLKVTGSVDIKGDFTVNGQSVFTQTSASNAGSALVVNGRIKVLEEQIGSYIASASIQVGSTPDTIDGGGFF
jgi:hypothetical protein